MKNGHDTIKYRMPRGGVLPLAFKYGLRSSNLYRYSLKRERFGRATERLEGWNVLFSFDPRPTSSEAL